MSETFDFLQNKYTKWYFNIISNVQNRDISGYTEKHHIIPKSLGGSNKQTNLNMPLHTCEHCNFSTTKGNYRRWHGGRCKLIAIKGELKFQD